MMRRISLASTISFLDCLDSRCFRGSYFALNGQLTTAGLNPYLNYWAKIHDFTPNREDPNYAISSEVGDGFVNAPCRVLSPRCWSIPGFVSSVQSGLMPSGLARVKQSLTLRLILTRVKLSYPSQLPPEDRLLTHPVSCCCFIPLLNQRRS